MVPFYTEGYSEREEEMFALGYEYATVIQHIRFVDGPLHTTVHRENSSRIRMACGKFKRRCTVEPCSPKDDPGELYATLTIEHR
jgi:hypothetical protein